MQQPDLNRLFGQNLRAVRMKAGLSQKALAEAAGVTRTYLNQVEGGGRRISLEMADMLAKAVGAELTALLRAPSRRG
jgi:transcriptional regulator with XRE-family HTH domain